jgi:hypothetical protein
MHFCHHNGVTDENEKKIYTKTKTYKAPFCKVVICRLPSCGLSFFVSCRCSIKQKVTRVIMKMQRTRIGRKVRKRIDIADRRRIELHAIVSAMRKTANALAAVAALACTRRVTASGQDHFVPEV